jgi:phosphoglycerate dehydrogenase-like enzyme
MNVYSLTKTLDSYVDFYNDDPAKAEVIVVGGSKIELEKYPNLKYIFKCGVGVDNIPNLDGTGIELVLPSESTRETIYNEVSDFTIYSILNAHFRKNGDVKTWDKVERPQFCDRKALVVGMGNIGKKVHHKLSTMLPSTFYDLFAISCWESLESAVRQSDIVTLHCPLTDHNHGMINMEWLKDDVILVNTARAPLVDEGELYQFLYQNPNATAVFDVFWKEPYEGRLLWCDNFIATPHVASFGDGFKKGLYNDLLDLLGETNG